MSSPFFRTRHISGSVVLTGMARIDDRAVVPLIDLEAINPYLDTEGEPSSDGWHRKGVTSDPKEVEVLTASVKVAGGWL